MVTIILINIIDVIDYTILNIISYD